MKLKLSDAFNFPNLITTVRIVLIYWIVTAILADDHGHAVIAFWLFVIAAATDWLDGNVARWLHETTKLGAILDPIADKLLLDAIFITFGFGVYWVPWWMVFIVVGRDVYILLASLGCLLFTPIRIFPPSDFGKASTFIQIMCVVAVLVSNAFYLPALGSLIDFLFLAVVAFAFLSAGEYTWQGIQRLWLRRA